VIARIALGRWAAAGQRKADLARFEQIKIEQLKRDR
jgi:hypothetical protein